MGTVEETGKVAASIVDGLKSQPLALALIVINILYMVFFGFIAHTMQARGTSERAAMMEQTTHLMDRCFGKTSQ